MCEACTADDVDPTAGFSLRDLAAAASAAGSNENCERKEDSPIHGPCAVHCSEPMKRNNCTAMDGNSHAWLGTGRGVSACCWWWALRPGIPHAAPSRSVNGGCRWSISIPRAPERVMITHLHLGSVTLCSAVGHSASSRAGEIHPVRSLNRRFIPNWCAYLNT